MRLILLILAAALATPAAAWSDPSPASILDLNKAASGGAAWPASATLKLDYTYAGQGLTGRVSSLADTRSGMFVEDFTIGPTHGGDGFDRTTPWMKDMSGAVTPELGGDKREIAVNDAYRDAELWWRPDHAGAALVALGRKEVDGRPCDALTITPEGGQPFEAWFDAKTHLLARLIERRSFQVVTTTFDDYRPVAGVLLAHKVVLNEGGGPQSFQTQTLADATLLPPEAASTYAAPRADLADASIEGGAHETTIPFTLLNNHVFAAVMVNGKGPFHFLFDTGGHDIVAPDTAKALGLAVDGRAEAHGAGAGTVESGYARVDSFGIGAARLRDQVVTVLRFEPPGVEGIPVDGMIGFETFHRFVTRFDYGASTITLTDPTSFDPRGAGTPVKFVFYEHMPQVSGSFEGLPAKYDIDTGSRVELSLTKPFVDDNQLKAKHPHGVLAVDGWGVGGRVQSYIARAGEMDLGPVAIPGVVGSFTIQGKGSFANPDYQGNVGSGLLKRFVATFDYDHEVMYLKPLRGPVADIGTFDRSGMWINACGEGFEIVDVAPGGPAETGGLKPGDVIVAVDGVAAPSIGLSALRMRLRDEAPGTVVTLRLKRSGETRDVPITLRDQI